MIKLGRVKGNKMVDMQLSNNKLIDRAVRMIQSSHEIEDHEARKMLETHGSVRNVIEQLDKAK